MKSPTDELLDLCPELNEEPTRPGFTDGLDLYDGLIDFVAPSSDPMPSSEQVNGVASERNAPADSRAASDHASAVETDSAKAAADSGALSHSEDVIRITGALTGFFVSRTADATTAICGDCGNLSDGGEMFCIHCGGLLEAAANAESASIVSAGLCDECGGRVESDEIFCPSCGSVMAMA
ncbi:MAG TPA: zinc ribbon domain-containing protein [Blastocatellia bacterium]|nr:zinc ribbon domain-containing protein [Blastocatellia bacterium]